MTQGRRHISTQTKHLIWLLAAAVALVPITTLLHDPGNTPQTTAQLQPAPPVLPDTSPNEDPMPGPAWSHPTTERLPQPPATQRAWATPTHPLLPGHLRRIDRPPRV